MSTKGDFGGFPDTYSRLKEAGKIETFDLQKLPEDPPQHFAAWAKVEEELPALAEPILDKLVDVTTAYGVSVPQVFGLPTEDLEEICLQAFEHSVDRLIQSGAAIGFLAMHPVLYHQITREFFLPYDSHGLYRCLADRDADLCYIVSVHDDIYDTYPRLLLPNTLWSVDIVRKDTLQQDAKTKQSSIERKPEYDIEHLHLLLAWRSQELSEAKRLATSLNARHLLIHQKGRARSLWRVVVDDEPPVYYSHPISQPRRDILGIGDGERYPLPDAARGRDFIKRSNELAGDIGPYCALLEPADIDELRFDFEGLENYRESDLDGKLLPVLTERWNLNGRNRLSSLPSAEEVKAPFPRALPSNHTPFRFRDFKLSRFEGALRQLAVEVKRQITVRDQTLVRQSGLVVVFEPFLPFTGKPSGGVDVEVREAQRKVRTNVPCCSPAIIIVHPYGLEKKRREAVFDRHWQNDFDEFFPNATDAQSVRLKEKARELIVTADYKPDLIEVSKDLKDAILQLGLTAMPRRSRGAMDGQELHQADQVINDFLDRIFRDRQVLLSKFHGNAEIVEFFDSDNFEPRELCDRIGLILDEFKERFRQ